MIISGIIYLVVTILNLFLVLLAPIFLLFPEITTTAGSGVGYIFGTMYQLNSFLPITELFALGTIALSFKIAVFAYQVVFYLLEIANTVRRTFVSLRI